MHLKDYERRELHEYKIIRARGKRYVLGAKWPSLQFDPSLVQKGLSNLNLF